MNTNLKLLLLFLLSAVLGFGCMMLVVNLNDKKGGGTTGDIVEAKPQVISEASLFKVKLLKSILLGTNYLQLFQ